jgi:hypothetical protein
MQPSYRRKIEAALCADIIREIDLAIEEFRQDYFEHESPLDIQRVGKYRLVQTRKHSLQGRPQKNALRNYIEKVVTIYERWTGKRIGRVYAVDAHKEKPHPFILACFSALQLRGHDYPAGIVKEILRELHPDAKRGRSRRTSL